MQGRTISIIGIIVLFIAALYVSASLGTSKIDEESQSQDVAGPRLTLDKYFGVKVKRTHQEDTNKVIEIWQPDTGVKEIDDHIQAFIDEEVESFEFDIFQNSQSWTTDDRKFGLSLYFDVVMRSDDLLGLVFVVERIMGSSQREQRLVQHVYEYGTGKRFSLASLFLDGTYLHEIAGLARSELNEQLGAGGSRARLDWIADGTQPAIENFQSFEVLSNDQIMISFAPHQVAPASEGVQSVTINLTEVGAAKNQRIFDLFNAAQEQSELDLEEPLDSPIVTQDVDELSCFSSYCAHVVFAGSFGEVEDLQGVLDALFETDTVVAFATPGFEAEHYPRHIEDIVAAGHHIVNAGWYWHQQFPETYAETTRDVQLSQQVLTRIGGRQPQHTWLPYGVSQLGGLEDISNGLENVLPADVLQDDVYKVQWDGLALYEEQQHVIFDMNNLTPEFVRDLARATANTEPETEFEQTSISPGAIEFN